ncbi:VOC family protein [Cytobacillus sp. IB215316]|uniref:VOC family protein n=1 Tax=Cytobacillus sp. IB215316 TaxID=3097354 RepID=UPI002A173BDA|nr:VOC family protein [Cytobacillus sp. IB215316]MDX8360060.1 VOC family protein [Cytobacillus sp. IB215316]
MHVQGFNHVTINISNLTNSLKFYVEVLGMELVHQGKKDAYLEWGSAWICLQEREQYPNKLVEQLSVDHVAFSISEDHFDAAVNILNDNEVIIVRGPIKRGTGLAINFLDPDGTQLELHTSTLADRMKVWK